MEKIATHIVIDMLYDFIDGSLACINGEQAVKNSISHINTHPEQKVIYVCDNHPINHCSFKENGGIWPIHCVAGTQGGAIDEDYYTQITNPANRPSKENIFYKGQNSQIEEYSGFNAINAHGDTLFTICKQQIIISGIATEYCVKETVLNLHNHQLKVTLLKNALAYVTLQGHLETLSELKQIALVK